MGRSGPGSRKRKSSWFQNGNKPWNKDVTYTDEEKRKKQRQSIKRLSHQDFQRTFEVGDDGSFTPRASRFIEDQTDGPGAVLRPQKHEKSEVEKLLEEKNIDNPVSGYVEVHLPTCVNVIQNCINDHRITNPKCNGQLTAPAEFFVKWGVSCIVSLQCSSCEYVSTKQKLFREIQSSGPGRKAAEPNRSLAVGLFQTSIAAAGAQRLLCSMNKPVPCQRSMQKQLNKVGETIRAVNEEDMSTQRSRLKDILQHGGFHRDTPIPAEADRQYNAPLRNSRGKTPFAPATQTRDVLAENLTHEKKVIAFNHESKLCKVGSCSRARGVQVKCPGHNGCTATLSVGDNVGDEKRGGRKLAMSLASGTEVIAVDKLCTDADGRMAEGFSAQMHSQNAVETEHSLDTVHLCRSLARAVSNSRVRPHINSDIPCNFKQRQQAINRLGDSLAWRAEHEVRSANQRFSCKDTAAKLIQAAIPAVIKCYEGNHSLCKAHSMVCTGNGDDVHEYIPKFAKGAFRFSTSDEVVLTSILRKRMGDEAVRKTRFSLTTQKVESTNHAFATTNPKHSMTCSRNGVNRDHSAIHMLNNQVGDSILLKARACDVPISAESPCLSTLHILNKRQKYFRLRSKSPHYKRRRAANRRRRYNCYDNLRNESFYVKSQLDPK